VIDKLYYSDFYSLPKYGKTKLGHYILHGKTGQNKELIREVVRLTKINIETILRVNKIDALAFVPHSIPRKVSFLKEYADYLDLDFPQIRLQKAYSGKVPVAQKSLSKLAERINNARQTIFVLDYKQNYARILLVDDALGSGATMNEVAKKLKQPHNQIYAYAIVGSYKGFEVIREV
jgi:predicted amidophosphoribosyltransferase